MKSSSKIFFTVAFAMASGHSGSSAYAQLAAPNASGVRFSHVHLNVTDAALHEKLWLDLFDARPIEMEGHVVVVLPGAQVYLRPNVPAAPSNRTAMDHIGLTVRSLDSILAEWRALGYAIDGKFERAGSVGAYITMPDGIRLELQEDSELPEKARMHHLHYMTPRYRELPAWYAELFGATRQSSSEDVITRRVPGASLVFEDSKSERRPTENTSIDHVGFEVDDMGAFVEKLKERDVEVVFGPKYIERLDLWVTFFNDPSGVLVEASEGLDKY